jgi:hypothetical protein
MVLLVDSGVVHVAGSRAPRSLARIDPAIASIKQGNNIREVRDELLDALTAPYREAAGGERDI